MIANGHAQVAAGKAASGRQVLALFAVLALVALAYLPGLRGPFVFDDYPNILNNPPVAVTEFSPQALGAAAREYG